VAEDEEADVAHGLSKSRLHARLTLENQGLSQWPVRLPGQAGQPGNTSDQVNKQLGTASDVPFTIDWTWTSSRTQ